MTTRDDGPEPVGWAWWTKEDHRLRFTNIEHDPRTTTNLPLQVRHIYLEPPQPKKAEPQGGEIVGWVEEDALPLTGRTTLHSEPNASRIALVRQPLQGEETP